MNRRLIDHPEIDAVFFPKFSWEYDVQSVVCERDYKSTNRVSRFRPLTPAELNSSGGIGDEPG